MKKMQLSILKAMKDNMIEEFQINGSGKDNVKAVHKVCQALQRWIDIVDIRTGQHRAGVGFMYVRCQTADGFHKAYNKAKERAKIINIVKSNKSESH